MMPGESPTKISGKSEKSSVTRFHVIGDWGGVPYPPFYSKNQKQLAEEMGRQAEAEPINFVVSTGDNLYFHGVEDEKSERFQHTFENVYNAKSLDVRWYMIPGNHDYEGDIQAQVNYTKYSKRWYFPSLYYTEQLDLGQGRTLSFVFIDTIQLCGLPIPNDRWTTVGPENYHEAEAHWKWIADELEKASEADFLVVVGHYPTASCGLHGADKEMAGRMRQLLHRFKVNLYLCGHDHFLQHFTSEHGGWTVHHCVVGTGSMSSWQRFELDKPNVFKEHLFSDEIGFAAVKINGDELYMKYISSSGQCLHTLSSPSRKLQLPSPQMTHCPHVSPAVSPSNDKETAKLLDIALATAGPSHDCDDVVEFA